VDVVDVVDVVDFVRALLRHVLNALYRCASSQIQVILCLLLFSIDNEYDTQDDETKGKDQRYDCPCPHAVAAAAVH
jgi:hypothetical protein